MERSLDVEFPADCRVLPIGDIRKLKGLTFGLHTRSCVHPDKPVPLMNWICLRLTSSGRLVSMQARDHHTRSASVKPPTMVSTLKVVAFHPAK
jgi:hypothetical protein